MDVASQLVMASWSQTATARGRGAVSTSRTTRKPGGQRAFRERELDARRRAEAHYALTAVARRARELHDLGHAHDVARFDRGKISHQLVEYTRCQRREGRGLDELVAASIIDDQRLE